MLLCDNDGTNKRILLIFQGSGSNPIFWISLIRIDKQIRIQSLRGFEWIFFEYQAVHEENHDFKIFYFIPDPLNGRSGS